MQGSFVQGLISTFSTLKSLLLLMSSGKVHFQGRFVCSLIVAGLTRQMGRFSVHHLDVPIQSMLVNSIVFTHITIEGPFLQVYCGHMPLKGELVSCGILANRTLVSDLAGSLMSVCNVSFQG